MHQVDCYSCIASVATWLSLGLGIRAVPVCTLLIHVLNEVAASATAAAQRCALLMFQTMPLSGASAKPDAVPSQKWMLLGIPCGVLHSAASCICASCCIMQLQRGIAVEQDSLMWITCLCAMSTAMQGCACSNPQPTSCCQHSQHNNLSAVVTV